MIHETVGSLSLRASYSNWPSGRCVRPLTASGESAGAFLKFAKFSSMLQP
jgi:hypothetical protein